MPSYPPRDEPVRKRQILKRREQELRHTLARGFSRDRIEMSAEKVRFAQLKLLKAVLVQLRFEPNDANTARLQTKASREEQQWETISVAEIISRYEG